MTKALILGYESIKVLKSFQMNPDKKILLFKEEMMRHMTMYGILFETRYYGIGDWKVERGGAYSYHTIEEAIDEFTSRINHYLKCLANHNEL